MDVQAGALYISKIADAPEGVRHLTFKSEEYSIG
jgi:hypothetical protein